MSRSNIEDYDIRSIRNRHPYQLSEVEYQFGDSSWPLFTMYSKIAEEEDNKMVERWQKDAEGIIIFTGLFSAVVATLVAVSIQDIRPNSQDASAFYLQQIYRLQAGSNLDYTTSHPPEESSLGDEYSPIATSSRHRRRHTLLLPSVPVMLLDPGNATQNTGGHPTILSTFNSNLRSPLVDPTCTPQLASTLIPTTVVPSLRNSL